METFFKKRKIHPYFAAIALKEILPDIKNIYNTEDIESHLRGSNLEFYEVDEKVPSLLVRLTLPFALVFIVLGFLYLPIQYITKGRWGYKSLKIKNWFNSLGL